VRRPFPWRLLLRPAACAALTLSALRTIADPDIWGHVRFGLDILRDRALPRVDPYSFTQDVPWINHEWLSEVAMGLAFAAAGATGLLILKWTFMALIVASLLWLSRDVEPTWRWAPLATLGFVWQPLVLSVRPHLWTALGLTLLLWLLRCTGRRRWLIPLLFVPWANAHGGWIVGLGVLALYLVGERVDPDRPPVLASVGLLATALLASLVTPYGLDLWRFLAATVRFGRRDVTEWQPIWDADPITPVTWLAVVVLWGAYLWRHGRVRGSTALIVVIFTIASMRVTRLLPHFAIMTAALIAREAPRRLAAGPAIRGRLAIDLVATAAACWAFAVLLEIPVCPTSRPYAPDGDMLRALARTSPSGRMVTFYNWGEYVIFHLGPRVRVSMDARRETVYSDALVDLHTHDINYGTTAGIAAVQRMAPDYVWLPLPRARPLRDWLAAHGYRIDLESPSQFVAVHATRPRVSAVPPFEGVRCFPAP
jgi:hypothetical protein